MTKNRIVKYATNTALLAVLAAAGIGAYQLGTSKPEENIQEEQDFVEMEQSTEEEPMVDVGTTEVEADMENTSGDLAGTEMADENNSSETESAQEETTLEEESQQPEEEGITGQAGENETTDAAAGAVEAPVLSFSEETQMEWPVNGNILLDYNMDQTVYFPTLDQYKLSPAISVQAAEGAPVLASVPGTVYSIEQNAQTGTTVTMEIGSGYQAVYGQLKDLAVEEGETVEKGTVIGYIAAPTKYYSEEGSNLYFAMKKDGEPVDPIAYLPE
ncbi:M23 family metallopeptidase [Blautia sp. XA-2221]|uniref:M23 family metallopeptidase n=1 Tax=Blautia sp. XA-2221 TaxID=2903961 RepID=UPI002378DA45|nr:M23 family metallopeptidase [Blautia sp. XA-2221]